MSQDDSTSFDPVSSERREFVRVPTDLPVRYKFLSAEPAFIQEEIFEGRVTDLSAGGILLLGRIPDLEWKSRLLNGSIVVGLNLDLADGQPPIKALTRVTWAETVEDDDNLYLMGLKFKEIIHEHLDQIFQYVIRAHMG